MNEESNKPIRYVKFPLFLKFTRLAPARNKVDYDVMMLKPQIKFPPMCVYCGKACSTVHDTLVKRNKTYRLAGVRSDQYIDVPVEYSETYPLPVCEEHLDDIKRNGKMSLVGLILGIVIFAVLGLVLSPWKTSDDIFMFLAWLGLASISIPFIRKKFPTVLGSIFKQFESAKYWPWIGFKVDFDNKTVALSFYNQSFAQEFAKVNESTNPTVEYYT